MWINAFETLQKVAQENINGSNFRYKDMHTTLLTMKMYALILEININKIISE